MTRAERLLLFAMGHCMLLLVRVVLPFGTERNAAIDMMHEALRDMTAEAEARRQGEEA